jgi:hypothetical protein
MVHSGSGTDFSAADESGASKTDNFLAPNGRMSTSARRGERLGSIYDETAINAAVAVAFQLASNSASAEALLEVRYLFSRRRIY